MSAGAVVRRVMTLNAPIMIVKRKQRKRWAVIMCSVDNEDNNETRLMEGSIK